MGTCQSKQGVVENLPKENKPQREQPRAVQPVSRDLVGANGISGSTLSSAPPRDQEDLEFSEMLPSQTDVPVEPPPSFPSSSASGKRLSDLSSTHATDSAFSIPSSAPDFELNIEKQVAVGRFGAINTALLGMLPVVAKLIARSPTPRTNASALNVLLRRQTQTLAGLNNPHLVSVIGSMQQVNESFMLEEYVPRCCSLRAAFGLPRLIATEQTALHALPRSSACDPATVYNRKSLRSFFRVSICIAHALEYLHQHRIAHRNLHPGTVLLAAHGVVKVSDYAQHHVANAVLGRANPEGSACGFFVAPEVLAGAEGSSKADVYSLAMIMYSMLSGKLPLQDMGIVDFDDIASALIQGGTRPVLPGAANQNLKVGLVVNQKRVPRGLFGLLERCWAAEPIERLTASDVLLILKALQRELDEPVRAINSGTARNGQRVSAGVSLPQSVSFKPAIDDTNDDDARSVSSTSGRGRSRSLSRASSGSNPGDAPKDSKNIPGIVTKRSKSTGAVRRRSRDPQRQQAQSMNSIVNVDSNSSSASSRHADAAGMTLLQDPTLFADQSTTPQSWDVSSQQPCSSPEQFHDYHEDSDSDSATIIYEEEQKVPLQHSGVNRVTSSRAADSDGVAISLVPSHLSIPDDQSSLIEVIHSPDSVPPARERLMHMSSPRKRRAERHRRKRSASLDDAPFWGMLPPKAGSSPDRCNPRQPATPITPVPPRGPPLHNKSPMHRVSSSEALSSGLAQRPIAYWARSASMPLNTGTGAGAGTGAFSPPRRSGLPSVFQRQGKPSAAAAAAAARSSKDSRESPTSASAAAAVSKRSQTPRASKDSRGSPTSAAAAVSKRSRTPRTSKDSRESPTAAAAAVPKRSQTPRRAR